jgi:hypothetical protein
MHTGTGEAALPGVERPLPAREQLVLWSNLRHIHLSQPVNSRPKVSKVLTFSCMSFKVFFKPGSIIDPNPGATSQGCRSGFGSQLSCTVLACRKVIMVLFHEWGPKCLYPLPRGGYPVLWRKKREPLDEVGDRTWKVCRFLHWFVIEKGWTGRPNYESGVRKIGNQIQLLMLPAAEFLSFWLRG